MRLKRLLAALTAIFGLATMTAFGQQSETALPRYLSVDVDVVLVNATVTDSQGHYVAKLGSEGFRRLPSFGAGGVALDNNGIRAHGKDERLPVQSFDTGVLFFYRYLKLLTSGP